MARDVHQQFEDRLHAHARRHFGRFPGVHHLGLNDVAAIGRDDMLAGEAVLNKLFEGHMVGPRSLAVSGLRALGNGSVTAGRRVLAKFLARASSHQQDAAEPYQQGGAVDPGEWTPERIERDVREKGEVRADPNFPPVKQFLQNLPSDIELIDKGPDVGTGPGESIRLRVRATPLTSAKGGKVEYSYDRVPLRYAKGGKVKMSKADAGYEACGDENRICVLCSMWRDKYRCSLVAGHIDRTGTCKHFEKA